MSDKEELTLHKNAKDLINQLSIVVRTAQIHDANNVAIASSINRLISMINILLEKEGMLNLELRGVFYYINDYRIRYSLEYLLNFDFLVREFRKRELGSVIFKTQIKMDDVKTFTRAFMASPSSDEPFNAFEENMSGVQSIDVVRLKKIVENEESHDVRKMI